MSSSQLNGRLSEPELLPVRFVQPRGRIEDVLDDVGVDGLLWIDEREPPREVTEGGVGEEAVARLVATKEATGALRVERGEGHAVRASGVERLVHVVEPLHGGNI
jgi:hypothetical protein